VVADAAALVRGAARSARRESREENRELKIVRWPRWPQLLALSASVLLAGACLDRAGAPVVSGPASSLAIAEENLRPGVAGWDTELHNAPDSVIAGYGLPFSLQAGDTLRLFVTAKRAPVSTAIYRLGWYNGAGARLMAEHHQLRVVSDGACSPPTLGPAVCSWPETDRFVIDPGWLPGVYLARFADSLGRTAAFPFVVRSPRRTAFVVVLPFATYHAYNDWGGASLYRGAGATPQEAYTNRAVKVSFARPFTQRIVRGPILRLDYLLVRWLERNAYDVSYVTDYDFDAGRGAEPDFAWLFAGHSEYWSWPMWLRANAARAEGRSLGFLGGNDAYWVIRFEHITVNGRVAPVVVCYRDATRDPLGGTPGLATVRFAAPPNNAPENALVGVGHAPHALIRFGPVDWVVANGADPLLAGTGLKTGDHIPRVAGWEADRIINNGVTPAGIRVLFEAPYTPASDTLASGLLQSTVYTWPASGAIVYAAGHPGFAWGLSTYRGAVARPPLEQFLRNLLQAFVAARGPR
jgi:hypothetical protein